MAHRFLVSHLTRMAAPRICVAGLDVDLRHVRPVVPGGWEWSALTRASGVFEIGAMVEFDGWADVGEPPEVEDRRSARAPTPLGRLPDERFAALMARVAQPTLTDIFGPTLERTSSGRASTPQHTGRASLGVLTARPVELVTSGDSVRARFADELGDMDLALTDARLVELVDGEWRLRRAACTIVGRHIERGDEPRLAVGLTRPFAPPGYHERRHWLQVNNLHFTTYFDDHPSLAR